MKYLIYIAVGLLTLWAFFFLVRQIRRQFKGRCGCGGCSGCAGDCSACAQKRR